MCKIKDWIENRPDQSVGSVYQNHGFEYERVQQNMFKALDRDIRAYLAKKVVAKPKGPQYKKPTTKVVANTQQDDWAYDNWVDNKITADAY